MRTLVLAALLSAVACAREATAPARAPSTGVVRSSRRAYDGAPPVVPHAPSSEACTSCHDGTGRQATGLGFAPPSPHAITVGMSATSRCLQCHVYQTTQETFVESTFRGLPQDLRHGDRLYPGAPPVMPHGVLMRENCSACHSGPAARPEIRTPHPERIRCRQCHVPVLTNAAPLGAAD